MLLPTKCGVALSRLMLCAVVFCFCAALSACGYTLSSQENSVLQDKSGSNAPVRLHIKEIHNPSLYPWVSSLTRELLHEEIQRQNLALWSNRDAADYLVAVEIGSISISGYAKDKEQTSRISSASVSLELVLYDRNNTVFWRSGAVSASESYIDRSGQESDAASLALQKALRYAVDTMRHNF